MDAGSQNRHKYTDLTSKGKASCEQVRPTPHSPCLEILPAENISLSSGLVGRLIMLGTKRLTRIAPSFGNAEYATERLSDRFTPLSLLTQLYTPKCVDVKILLFGEFQL